MPIFNKCILYIISVSLVAMCWMLNSCGERTNAKEKYMPKGRKVEVVWQNGQYTLLRNGEPYFIKGAGGYTHFEKIKENGGNSVRVWHEEDAQRILDEAHENGLSVTLGLWVTREKEGFNYYDKKQVAQQLERLRKVVHRYKDHPALLMWGVGNEVNNGGTNVEVWDAVNEIAEMIHEVDPDHPTTTTLIGVPDDIIKLVLKKCPAIDVLSFNTFGGKDNMDEKLRNIDWEGPYIISEFGAQGYWEVYTTWWNAPLEQTSSMKALYTRDRYSSIVTFDRDRSLGGYVFYWGEKHEATPTWFSLILETGEETETVGVMRELWTGNTSTNKAPYVAYVKLNGVFDYQNAYLKPQQEYNAAVYAFDPDGDSLRVEWEMLPETFTELSGNVNAEKPDPVPNVLGEASGNNISLRAPQKTGPYRLYAYIYDGQGHVATGNIPFYVSKNPLH